MSEQETIKVYELAKELGIDSISLLDKLNGLDIKVKSHMSELAPNDVQRARETLSKKASTASASKTGAKVRKKVASPASDDAAPATAKPAAKATTAKTTTRKAAAIAAPVAAKPAAPAPIDASKASAMSPIIRRRVKSDGDVASTVVNKSGEAEAHEGGHQHAEYSDGQQTEAEAYADAQGYAQEDAGMETQDGGAQAADETQGSDMAASASSEAPAEGVSASPAAPEGVKPRAAVVLPPRPVAPRRSILKIVEPQAPPPRPMVKPTGTPAVAPRITKVGEGGPTPSSGFRITKLTKENLDQMVEEEAAKKRGGGGRELGVKPEDVRFADYRKKEMVFLPKRKRLPVGKEVKKTQLTQMKAEKRIVEMGEAIKVQDLANQLSVKAIDVVRKLMGMGQMVNVNASVDFDTATLVAGEYKYEVRNVSFKEEELLDVSVDTAAEMQSRPPIVTIMGHVDHGKTSLLDAIRKANVAAGEAGGITQHIGAYTVDQGGKMITFIDTPGHEAFTVMRARGANVTDIVVLVVAADDGVMPQTREALSHAQAAKVPIIVAVNKIDKAQANPEKVKQGLSELNLLPEEWGGDTMFVPVSAIKQTNLDKLLEAILLQAEVLDLKANPEAQANGTVLEARLEKGRGPVVSLLVSRGTLHVGDPVVAGQFAGRVKAMVDHHGKPVKEVKPGWAAEVLGFEGVPNAGEKFVSPKDDDGARLIAQNRIDAQKIKATVPLGKVSLDDLFSKIQTGNMKELNIVLKADAFGSVEAIRDSLLKLSNEKVKVKVLHSAAGGITESDVLLAGASEAIIIGFNVRPETKARQVAEAEHVEVKCYSIIYELIDDVRKSMTGLLDKKKVEKFLGRAEVRQTFTVPKIGMIAGSAVIDGKIVRGANVRLLRESRVIYEGKMSSLKRFKDDAKEVATGYECGIGLENYNDLKPGDLIEAYEIEMVAPELNS